MSERNENVTNDGLRLEAVAERKAWVRSLAKISDGEIDAVVMHVDTLRLLTDQDWDDMKVFGLSVGIFAKEERDE